MDVRVTHRLEPQEAARRIRDAGRKLGLEEVESESAGELHGTFTKGSPLGAVSASWTVEQVEVVIHVLKKPAFLPGSTVARLLEDGLRDALGDG